MDLSKKTVEKFEDLLAEGKRQHKENAILLAYGIFFAALFAVISGLSGAVFSKLFEWLDWAVWLGFGAIFLITILTWKGLRDLNKLQF